MGLFNWTENSDGSRDKQNKKGTNYHQSKYDKKVSSRNQQGD